MFYTVLLNGNNYFAGNLIDVVVYDPSVTSLRARVTGDATGFPANAITVIADTDTSTGNTAGSTNVSVPVSVSATDVRDYFAVRVSNITNVVGRELVIEGLSSAGAVLRASRFYINSPVTRYKKVSYINSFEDALAEFTARQNQIRAMRSKSYTWRVDIVVDPPPAPEIHISLPPTQVFGIESVFEPRPYGQGFDMVVNAQLYVPFATLSAAVDRLFAAMLQRVLDRQELGTGDGRGLAMVEFYNDDYSLVLNDVPVAPQMKFNANGLETNANENASGILIILTGRSMLELVSGFTHKKPI